mmetsp:Transcript_4889/g.15791  ORF Transcript_4889/g.15791 Transcript_4889/m.15791 type:complete len:229 (-) Transcript_4889:427-1113(-)
MIHLRLLTLFSTQPARLSPSLGPPSHRRPRLLNARPTKRAVAGAGETSIRPGLDYGPRYFLGYRRGGSGGADGQRRRTRSLGSTRLTLSSALTAFTRRSDKRWKEQTRQCPFDTWASLSSSASWTWTLARCGTIESCRSSTGPSAASPCPTRQGKSCGNSLGPWSKLLRPTCGRAARPPCTPRRCRRSTGGPTSSSRCLLGRTTPSSPEPPCSTDQRTSGPFNLAVNE